MEVIGLVIHRILRLRIGEYNNSELALLVNNIISLENQRVPMRLTRQEKENIYNKYWQRYRNRPFVGRNKIIHSVCPDISELHGCKLALLLSLIGGISQEEDSEDRRRRGDIHLLLVGDPGTGIY